MRIVLALLFIGCTATSDSDGEEATETDAADTDASDDTSSDSGDDTGSALGLMDNCPEIDTDMTEHGDLYSHYVIQSTGSNGTDFTRDDRTLLEHASVPDGVVRSDDSVWVYYVSGQPGHHGPWIAERQSDGTLEMIGCVKLDGEFNYNAVDPDIMRLEDGRYRLYYFEGWFVDAGPPEMLHPLMAATSTDGINFEVDQVALSVENALDPTVVKYSDELWVMAYNGMQYVGIATSSDGLNFTKSDVEFEMGIPEVAVIDNKVRLFIASQDGMEMYDTTDAVEWSSVGNLGHLGADPSLVKRDDEYVLYTKMHPPPE